MKNVLQKIGGTQALLDVLKQWLKLPLPQSAQRRHSVTWIGLW